MPKINPSSIKRPPRQTKKFTLTVGDEQDALILRRMSAMEQARAGDRAEELVARFIGSEDVEPVETLPPVDGEPVVASRRTFLTASLIHEAQQVASDADRYSPQELVMLMQSDDVVAQISKMFLWLTDITPEDDRVTDPKGTSSEGSTPSAS